MKRIEWCGIVGFLLAGCVAASPGAAVRASADGGGELRAVIDQVQSDRGALGRFFDVEGSTARIARLRLKHRRPIPARQAGQSGREQFFQHRRVFARRRDERF